ncbi:phospholipase D family protein [Polaromonas eurypsychrophila]|uniref:Phospholipase D family protein n=1 Tax=Polaromonas eurypsychrophila TaxID=1614635 RepID=A0A916WJ47_9BURK|nr:phospholipase D family protein [Polaromonas eurypsychrophila]GGB02538.1 phospholipase D family protein [Polaromonas eurypsychrophila]
MNLRAPQAACPTFTAWRWLALLTLGAWLTGCASLPSEVDRPVSTALANPEQTRIGNAVQQRAARAGTRNDSGFALVNSAELAFTSRMALINAAQKTLDIQYYAIHADETTERMFDALRAAAARGVRIRILLDDFNTAGKNAQVLKIAFEPNIELRLFNPLPGNRRSLFFRILGSLKDVDRIQRRMHNKIFVADNAVAITGGRNLGETYFGQGEGTNFVDADVLAAGRIARELSHSFDQYWNNPLAYPVQSLMTRDEIEKIKPPSRAAAAAAPPVAAAQAPDGPSVQPTPASPAATQGMRTTTAPDGTVSVIEPLPDSTNLALLDWTWAPAVLLVDKPSKIAADADDVQQAQDTTVDGLLQLMSQASGDLLIVSPYFVPGQRMMDQFAAIRQKGVRIRVLTNSLASNDAPAAHIGYARYRKELLALGIEIYEMRAEQKGSLTSFGSTGSSGSAGGSRASLHSKIVVLDQRLLVIGSMNLDLRSQLQNTEVALAIRSSKLAGETIALIEPAMARGAYKVELLDGQLMWRAPQDSKLADTRSEPDASTGLKLMLKLLGPFAPEEML